jgi:hypothetical protein
MALKLLLQLKLHLSYFSLPDSHLQVHQSVMHALPIDEVTMHSDTAKELLLFYGLFLVWWLFLSSVSVFLLIGINCEISDLCSFRKMCLTKLVALPQLVN